MKASKTTESYAELTPEQSACALEVAFRIVLNRIVSPNESPLDFDKDRDLQSVIVSPETPDD